MDEFNYFIAAPEECAEIRQFIMEHFLHEETMNVATGITEDEFAPYADRTLSTSLITPFSVICRDEKGKIAGVALSSVIHRRDLPVKDPLGHPRRLEVAAIASICGEVQGSAWDLLDPNINTVLELDIISVGLPYQRRGIAGRMLDQRESPDLLEKYNIEGFICQASSFANQKLMKKRGHQALKEVPFSRFLGNDGIPLIKPQDETKSVILFWKPYRPP